MAAILMKETMHQLTTRQAAQHTEGRTPTRPLSKTTAHIMPQFSQQQGRGEHMPLGKQQAGSEAQPCQEAH